MRVAGFDPGFPFGWAIIPTRGKPKAGSKRIPGSPEELGVAMCEACDFLDGFLKEHKPDVIVRATPWISPKATPQFLTPLFAFIGAIDMVAARHLTAVHKVSEQTARSWFLPVGAPRKRPAVLHAIVRECFDRGTSVPNDHAGDALCCAMYGRYDLKKRKVRVEYGKYEAVV